MFYSGFISTRNLRGPSADRREILLGSIFYFIAPVQKFGACPPKKFGGENTLILARFRTSSHFECKYLWNR